MTIEQIKNLIASVNFKQNEYINISDYEGCFIAELIVNNEIIGFVYSTDSRFAALIFQWLCVHCEPCK